ncbi:MAG: hypothetical protein MUE81_15400 [Thermoflexibacter sp.]|jgi:hypothetical protein|nr:hypothetical protein [Thermoflexibacter sp.]
MNQIENPEEQFEKDLKEEIALRPDMEQNEIEENEINGFQLFMQNAKGDFKRIMGCGG